MDPAQVVNEQIRDALAPAALYVAQALGAQLTFGQQQVDGNLRAAVWTIPNVESHSAGLFGGQTDKHDMSICVPRQAVTWINEQLLNRFFLKGGGAFTNWSASAGATVVSDTTAIHGKSARFPSTGTPTGISQTLSTMVAGGTFSAAASVRWAGPNPARSVVLILTALPSSTTFISTPVFPLTTWTNLSLTGTIPAGTTSCVFQVYSTGVAGDLWYCQSTSLANTSAGMFPPTYLRPGAWLEWADGERLGVEMETSDLQQMSMSPTITFRTSRFGKPGDSVEIDE